MARRARSTFSGPNPFPASSGLNPDLPREDESVSQSRFAKHYPASWGVKPFVPNPLFAPPPPKTVHDIVEEFGARTLAEARAAKTVAKARRKVKGGDSASDTEDRLLMRAKAILDGPTPMTAADLVKFTARDWAGQIMAAYDLGREHGRIEQSARFDEIWADAKRAGFVR
jgi:hypothetical protein